MSMQRRWLKYVGGVGRGLTDWWVYATPETPGCTQMTDTYMERIRDELRVWIRHEKIFTEYDVVVGRGTLATFQTLEEAMAVAPVLARMEGA